ncbi:MarR family transcriptional regulator [Bacillus sp. CECT 9360]|uniref:MarR family winged helix-turn-helix transcriptional regulator n=1 Tax=Bacillus sp. CECT 9360 TaxID=2845821 RepID=UPI001E337E6A|nr:MarR family transcriptional regulator [Bacillus sp. CECT 9360]
MRKEFNELFGTEINSNEFLVLKFIAVSGSQKASALSKELDVSASHITTVTDFLVKKDLLTRNRMENDRRVVNFELTDKGKEMIEDLEIKKTEYLARKFGKLTDEELTTFLELIKKIR